LDARIQDGKKLPKWNKRSRQGIYLGLSRAHSTTVALVLNPVTGYVSPQYHCVFDDHFSTVHGDDAPFTADIWNSLVSSNLEKHEDIYADEQGNVHIPPDATEWSTGQPLGTRPQAPPEPPDPPHQPPRLQRENMPVTEPAANIPPPQVTFDLETPGPTVPPTTQRVSSSPTPPPPPAAPTLRRSTRHNKGVPDPNPFTYTGKGAKSYTENLAFADYVSQHEGPVDTQTYMSFITMRGNHGTNMNKQTYYRPDEVLPRTNGAARNNKKLMRLNWDNMLDSFKHSTIGAFLTEVQTNTVDGYLEYFNPALLAAKANEEDTPNWTTAMTGPDKTGWLQACKNELQALAKLSHTRKG
jgi:hypothetical protein